MAIDAPSLADPNHILLWKIAAGIAGTGGGGGGGGVGSIPGATFDSAIAASKLEAFPLTLYSVSGFNPAGADVYIQLFDSVTLPADGVAPKHSILAPAGSNYSFDFGARGIKFATGLAVCTSSTFATKTLAGAALLGIAYIAN